MALDEERRFQLRETFRDLYGDEVADAMMEAYPPAGLEGAALAGAMAELRLEMADLRTELKGEMAGLRTELKGEMSELRVELKGEMAGLRTEMHVLFRRHTLALAGMMAAGWGGLAALIGLD